MDQLEPETEETLAQEARKRKRGCCCGLGCMGMVLLFILMLSSVEPSRESDRQIQCSNNEKQIVLYAMHCYHDVCKSFPPAYTTDENGKPLHSWRVLVLPYLEEYELFKQIRLDEPWDSEYNRQFHDKMPRVYSCPTAWLRTRNTGKTSMTCYMRVVGTGTTTNGTDTVKIDDVKDQMAGIVALVEVYPTVNWMAPVDISPEELVAGIDRKKKQSVGSYHGSGRNVEVNVATLDGSVEFVPEAEVPALAEKVVINTK